MLTSGTWPRPLVGEMHERFSEAEAISEENTGARSKTILMFVADMVPPLSRGRLRYILRTERIENLFHKWCGEENLFGVV